MILLTIVVMLHSPTAYNQTLRALTVRAASAHILWTRVATSLTVHTMLLIPTVYRITLRIPVMKFGMYTG